MIKTIAVNIGLIAAACAVVWASAQLTSSIDDYAAAFERMDRQVAEFNGCGNKLAKAVGFAVK